MEEDDPEAYRAAEITYEVSRHIYTSISNAWNTGFLDLVKYAQNRADDKARGRLLGAIGEGIVAWKIEDDMDNKGWNVALTLGDRKGNGMGLGIDLEISQGSGIEGNIIISPDKYTDIVMDVDLNYEFSLQDMKAKVNGLFWATHNGNPNAILKHTHYDFGNDFRYVYEVKTFNPKNSKANQQEYGAMFGQALEAAKTHASLTGYKTVPVIVTDREAWFNTIAHQKQSSKDGKSSVLLDKLEDFKNKGGRLILKDNLYRDSENRLEQLKRLINE